MGDYSQKDKYVVHHRERTWQRRNNILEWLIFRQFVKGRELAKALKCTRLTIRADIIYLRSIGYNIIGIRGSGYILFSAR